MPPGARAPSGKSFRERPEGHSQTMRAGKRHRNVMAVKHGIASKDLRLVEPDLTKSRQPFKHQNVRAFARNLSGEEYILLVQARRRIDLEATRTPQRARR